MYQYLEHTKSPVEIPSSHILVGSFRQPEKIHKILPLDNDKWIFLNCGKKIIPTPTYNAITYHFILHYFRNEENKNQVLIVTYFYTDIYCNKKTFPISSTYTLLHVSCLYGMESGSCLFLLRFGFLRQIPQYLEGTSTLFTFKTYSCFHSI